MTYIYTVDLWYIFTGAAQIQRPPNVGTPLLLKPAFQIGDKLFPAGMASEGLP